jgi:hypothetical protein
VDRLIRLRKLAVDRLIRVRTVTTCGFAGSFDPKALSDRI